ncbi:precorrin-4 C(11)-methyltransferase [Pseudomonas sp. Boi14]|nr:precorrin-4 C(11)-methyltransferase [Pseudomonas sp. Boi14]
MTVYFIGAGPGDPELITVKGQRLIHRCPVIIYAGSLVPQAVLDGHRAERVINSAELHLEQIIEAIKQAHARGQDVARVHSGDPSLYGAIGEQIRCLRELGIPFEIIPGSPPPPPALPCWGRTDPAGRLPERDSYPLRGQDRDACRRGFRQPGGPRRHHGHSPGVNNLPKIVAELLPHYGADCPIAVVHRATWPDQDWALGTLADIVDQVAAKGFRRTALILVGRVLATDAFSESSLYRAGHAHLYRP